MVPPKVDKPAQMITTNKAARIIGCSPQQVRTLLRKGALKGKKTERDEWKVEEEDAIRYSKVKIARGWPRGVARKEVTE